MSPNQHVVRKTDRSRSDKERKENIVLEEQRVRDNWSENMKPINPYQLALVIIGGFSILAVIIFGLVLLIRLYAGGG